jgi:predicted PhzF superfamily epimerase YddE/YHI9
MELRRTRIVQVNAFTSEPFKGNPAAVCVLEEERDAVTVLRGELLA